MRLWQLNFVQYIEGPLILTRDSHCNEQAKDVLIGLNLARNGLCFPMSRAVKTTNRRMVSSNRYICPRIMIPRTPISSNLARTRGHSA